MPQYLDKLVIDPTLLHPDFALAMAAEAGFLNKNYPLQDGWRVSFNVSDKYLYDPHVNIGIPGKDKQMTGAGLTATNTLTKECAITLMDKMFGPKSDPEYFRKMEVMSQRTGFHGSMIGKAYVLTHEYGHVLDAMIHDSFIDDDKERYAKYTNVRDLYTEFYIMGFEKMNKAIEDFGMLDAIAMKLFSIFPYNKKDPERLVSSYSITGGPNEYWAETFSALCFASAADKQLPTVKKLAELLAAAYAAFAEVNTVRERVSA